MLSAVDDFDDDLDGDNVVVFTAVVVGVDALLADSAVPLLRFEGLEDVVEGELLFFSVVRVSEGSGDSKNAFRASAIDFFVGVVLTEGAR